MTWNDCISVHERLWGYKTPCIIHCCGQGVDRRQRRVWFGTSTIFKILTVVEPLQYCKYLVILEKGPSYSLYTFLEWFMIVKGNLQVTYSFFRHTLIKVLPPQPTYVFPWLFRPISSLLYPSFPQVKVNGRSEEVESLIKGIPSRALSYFFHVSEKEVVPDTSRLRGVTGGAETSNDPVWLYITPRNIRDTYSLF